jgi:hypothetical protein
VSANKSIQPCPIFGLDILLGSTSIEKPLKILSVIKLNKEIPSNSTAQCFRMYSHVPKRRHGVVGVG